MQKKHRIFGTSTRNRTMNIVCLHGFLGNRTDWMSLELDKHIDADFHYPSLFSKRQSITPFWEWAKSFNESVSSGSLLVGYSLGGRLAMHAVLENPHLYRGAIIISSHYGLRNLEERSARLQHDKKWAERFMQDEWKHLISDWNSQPVFREDIHTFDREEKKFSRESLAHSLDVWSMGRQDYLKEQIEKLTVPILFIAGEQDIRYASLARTLNFSSTDSSVWIVKGAGHRVPWQQRSRFVKKISSFVSILNEIGNYA